MNRQEFEIVHVATEKQLEEILVFLDKDGYTWGNGKRPTKHHLQSLDSMYNEQTCIFLKDKLISYGNVEFCNSQGYSYVSFQEFMIKHAAANLNVKVIQALKACR